ncbi:MAG TPA: SUMF1/EgtB/PvdO family nonheme iron enzyme [Verrucomicrobiae bacterium]|nr:SUMF1/EgtB/PvdO family nonheme iron enzyme [Verrucomicrobiae bacterium]
MLKSFFRFSLWMNSIIAVLLGWGAASAKGELILSDSFDVPGNDSPGTGFGTGTAAGVNYQISGRLTGTAASGLRYIQTDKSKPTSSYSIVSNRVQVAAANNPGRFTFTANGTAPQDLGPALGLVYATPASPVVYELAAKISNQSSGIQRTSFGVATTDEGVQGWALGVQLVNNGANLEIYRRVDSSCNSSGADYNNVIATLVGKAGTEVDLRIHISDAGAESGTGNFNSSYQVFANGTLIFSSAPGEFRFAGSAARLILFDTAPNAGPVTYDAFSLTLSDVTNLPPTTNLPLRILSSRLDPAGFELTWSSQKNTNYSVLKCTNLFSGAWTLVTNVTAADTNTTVVEGISNVAATYYRVARLVNSGLGVNQVTATQRAGTSLVDIYYDLSDLYGGWASISILVSTNDGQSFQAPAASISGDIGNNIAPGSERHIVWDVGADWLAGSSPNVRIQVIADRAPHSTNMALIPAGTFNMGDAKGEGLACETPVHAVATDAFYLERFEVSKALWDSVAQWGTNHGYVFESPAVAAAGDFPVQQISWYDAVKWCNARSEKEGLAPAYFTDWTWTSIYRAGQLDLNELSVRWQGAGYRLPTEAEWEKAGRGGLEEKRFPLGDTITQAQADYWSTPFESFDVNGTSGPHPLALEFPNALPVGSFAPSGYGLYDMAGNTWEWCWDYYGDSWYSDGRASDANTRGPSSASWGGDRVYRGGSGVDNAWKSRVANRADAPPRFAMGHFGFRVALPAGDSLVAAESAIFTINLEN